MTSYGDKLPEVGFDSPEGVKAEAPEGHLKFAWATDTDLPGGASYVFERSRKLEFTEPVELYRGADKGTYVSGLAEGMYYFRVYLEKDGISGPSSPVLSLKVQYVDRGKVATLMIVGFAVFVATVAAILVGHFRTRERES